MNLVISSQLPPRRDELHESQTSSLNLNPNLDIGGSSKSKIRIKIKSGISGTRVTRPYEKRLPRSCHAFTLIEVLVSTAILVLIIFAIYSTWTAILRGSKLALDAAVEVQRSRIAVRSVEDSLLTAQLFGENMRYYAFLTDTKDENFHYLSLVSRLPPTFPGSGMFGDHVLRRVTFEVVPGEDNKNQLIMSQMPVLLMTNETIQPYPITLVRDLTWFVLEFWDPQRAQWMAEFKATNQLPVMMRVTVGWGHAKNNPSEPLEVVTRTVAIPASMITGEIQRPQ